MSASFMTIKGLLPPNSKVILLMPAVLMMCLPTAVEPVKAILSTRGCLIRASPAILPKPGNILMTPSGKPAYNTNSPNFKAVKGVFSAGLRTTVHPVAIAGAIFKIAIRKGKFHGII